MAGTRFGRVTVTGLLVALAVGGCDATELGGAEAAPQGPVGEASGGPGANPGPDGSNPANPGPDGSNPANPGPDSSNPANPEVAWVPPGPGIGIDYKSPETDRWYEAFNNRDCKAIAALGPERNQQQLYQGLGEACLAIYRDEDRSWSAAEVALRRVGDEPIDCLDRLAFRLLRDLVMAHQRAPDAEIRIVNSPPGDACSMWQQ